MTDFMKAVAGLLTAIVALATLLITLGVINNQSASPTAPSGTSVLVGRTLTERMSADEELHPGDQLIARNGETYLTLQSDGDIAIYSTATKEPIWKLGKAGSGGQRLLMQADGNLVLYAAGDRSVWDTASPGYDGAFVAMQDDWNLVLYNQDATKVLWTSNTAR